mgnify:CR=1 FL=1
MVARMLDWIQIGLTTVIILLMMFAIKEILKNPDNKEARKEFLIWALVAAILIGQAIW